MSDTTDTQPTSEAGGEREQALRRIKQKRDLGAHLVAYLVVNAGLWAIWAATGGYLWPLWVSGLWAIGLVLNAWDVYVRSPIAEADVQREMRRMHAAR
jgi:hypothetical protein